MIARAGTACAVKWAVVGVDRSGISVDVVVLVVFEPQAVRAPQVAKMNPKARRIDCLPIVMTARGRVEQGRSRVNTNHTELCLIRRNS